MTLSTKGTTETRTTHKRRVAVLAIPAVAAGLLMAGCQQTPGTAAIIGGERVKASEVQSSTTAFLDLVPNQFSEGDVQLLVLERDIYSFGWDNVGCSSDDCRFTLSESWRR